MHNINIGRNLSVHFKGGGGSRLSLVKQWPLRPISISHPLLIVNSVSPGLLSFMEMFGLEWMVELQ